MSPPARPIGERDAGVVVADAYEGVLEEFASSEYTDSERALLAEPVLYYGRWLDPTSRSYAVDSVVRNIGRAIEYLSLARRPIRILDVGCGLGMQSFIFARYGAEVTGVDLDPRCVALAEKRQRFYERRWGTKLAVRFVAASFHDFARTHPPGEYDAAFSMSAFAHIPPLSETVAELSRLLAPTAKIYIWDLNPDFVFLNHVRSFGRPDASTVPRPKDIRAALEKENFRLDLLTGGQSIPRHFWRWEPLNGLVAAGDRLLRQSVRLSYNYVIGAHRGASG